MKKFIIGVVMFIGVLLTSSAFGIEDKKSIAIFPLDAGVNSASYAMYSNTQDMFASDLVNSLQQYKDLDVVDINSAEKIIELSGLKTQYTKLVKQYKQRYVIDYEKTDMLAQALGVNYIVFIHGGFDMEKSFLKSNWKYRCQWIWASQISSSAQLSMNVTLIDVKNRNYAFQETVKKDIPMNNFQEASNVFGENIVPISQIKKFTKPKSIKIAQKIHNIIYPEANTKYAQKDAFVDRFVPNNEVLNDNMYNATYSDYNNGQRDNATINADNSVNNARKETYKNWVEQNSK